MHQIKHYAYLWYVFTSLCLLRAHKLAIPNKYKQKQVLPHKITRAFTDSD